jgi:hypothetical protein
MSNFRGLSILKNTLEAFIIKISLSLNKQTLAKSQNKI